MITSSHLRYCYGEFDYRSIGLIVHMAYEWAQRLGDMRTLTWDKLDLEAQRCDLTQRKRGAEVHLPHTTPAKQDAGTTEGGLGLPTVRSS